MPDYEPAVILSACRTPIGSFGGALKDLSAADLGAVVIRGAICRAGIEARDLGDVIMGCVLQAGAGMNVARQAALKAGVPQDVPGETVNRVCGSGLQAVVHAVEATRVGYTELVLAGGTESMSNAPYILKGARWGYRMGHGELLDSMLAEGLTCAIQGCHMGITAEEIVTRFKVSRADQDAFAAESQRRAGAAVTLPSFLNAALSAASFSALAPERGYSSRSKTVGAPFLFGTSTGTISSLKRPCAMACSARRWLSAAKASWSWRLTLYLVTISSAVMPMWQPPIAHVNPSASMESSACAWPMR